MRQLPIGVILALALGAPAFARAETATTTATTTEDPWLVSRLRIPWTEPSGTGVALGYENGSWGGEWAQGIRLRIPIGSAFSIDLRGLVLGGLNIDRWDLGGRLDLSGGSPVFLNFVRIYGGGGVQVFRPVAGVDQRKVSVGGGGHFGMELFLTPFMSWIFEVGGSSGSQDGFGAGATIMAGVQFYPF